MRRLCPVSGQQFDISEEELAFYQRMKVPPPALHPVERQRRRIVFRNFRNLYRRSCDGTGKSLISMYHADQPFPVFASDYWWSDSWDALSYGRECDFSRPFFEQYADLAREVPRSNIVVPNTENCHYSNFAVRSKNCYLVFGCVENADCYYGHIVWHCEHCVDTLYAYRCRWCTNSVDIVDCYDVHFSQEAANCRESWFLFDCSNCQNCFACTNLRGKQYYFCNQPLSKAEYDRKIAELLPLSRETASRFLRWLAEERSTRAFVPERFGIKNEEVSGNHIYESKDVQWGFDVKRGESSRYCYTTLMHSHCYDLSFGGQTSFAVDSLTPSGCQEVLYCHSILDCHNLAYCEFCFSSRDLLGCNGLRSKRYCILNKQYEKQEYFTMRERIIEHMKRTGEWGEFFPISLSPFAYQESIAGEYLPLADDEILRRGGTLLQRPKEPQPTVKAELPDLNAPDEEIIAEAYSCEGTGKAYRILPQELQVYRRLGIPLPDCCPDERHRRRMQQREPRRIWNAQCSACGKGIASAFSPEVYPRILCEACYLEQLY